jgi:hypothetical protein
MTMSHTLEEHKAFYDELVSYLPQNELTEQEPEPVTPADTAPTRPNPPPRFPVPNQGRPPSPKMPHNKIRPGFEGARIVRKKRSA